MRTVLQPCTCHHAYQDATYGRGLRVHNLLSRGGKDATAKARCTVCSNVRVVRGEGEP